jgi:hypothetical protein
MMNNFGGRGLQRRHVKVLIGVYQFTRITGGKAFPKDTEIAGQIGVAPEEFESELRDLVEMRYLHEIMPTFGPLTMRYKLGSVGGTLMRQIMPPENGSRPEISLPAKGYSGDATE